MKDSFSLLHPIINFLYFTVVLFFCMFFMNPIFIGINLMCSFLYLSMLKGFKAAIKKLIHMLFILLIVILINTAFNHQGATILFYLKNGNPITLESIIYGLFAASMFISSIIWFSCYNEVMTSDKFIYIFGRIMPSLSLIFSMALRFVPRFVNQIKEISNAQKCIGKDISHGSRIKRVHNGIKILSIMTTYALENAIDTADSMKSRGYGNPNRTRFSVFFFYKEDKVALTIILILISIVTTGAFLGKYAVSFYPVIEIAEITPFSMVFYISYILLCLIPIEINILEELKWKYSVSKM